MGNGYQFPIPNFYNFCEVSVVGLNFHPGIILLILGGMVSGVGIAEVGLQIAGIKGTLKISEFVESSPTVFHTTDLDRGWGLKPNASGWWRDEGESFVEINSHGLRARSYSKIKPENTLRIAVLGDSFTEAVHVPLEQTFWSVMERELTKCSAVKNQQIEVINFGVHGYGTAQELITLRTRVWDDNPDVVILAFFAGNDLINNSKKLESDLYRPFFVYRNGELVEDLSFRQLNPGYSNRYAVSFVDNLPEWLVEKSRVLQVIKKVDLDRKKRRGLAEYRRHSFYKFNPPSNEVWEEAWKITEDLILLMREEVEEKGASFGMAVIPSPLQVHPDENKRKRKQEEFGVKDWFYVGKRLEKLGDRRDFPVWDLTKPFLNYSVENQVCLHGFEPAADCGGHWNGEGHRLAGEILADNVCQGSDGKNRGARLLRTTNN
jgi:hypothetical protein